MRIDDNTSNVRARWRYLGGKAWIALLGAVAALTIGGQALATAPASAAINNGGNCVDLPWLPECQPTGGGGGGGIGEPEEEEQQLEEEEELDEEEQQIEEEERIREAEEEEAEKSNEENSKEVQELKRIEEIQHAPVPLAALEKLAEECRAKYLDAEIYGLWWEIANNTNKPEADDLGWEMQVRIDASFDCSDLYDKARKTMGLPPQPAVVLPPGAQPFGPPTLTPVFAKEIAEQVKAGAHPTQLSLACFKATAGARACTAAVTDTSANPIAPSGAIAFVITSAKGGDSQDPVRCSLAASAANTATCTINNVPAAGGGGNLLAAYGGDASHAMAGGSFDLATLEAQERQQREAEERLRREAEERLRREAEERQLREMERREREERERREREHIIER
jgi:hypothetical protein